MTRCRSRAGLAILVASAVSCTSPRPLPPSLAPASGITAESVRTYVVTLADDSLEGRGSGYPGEKKAVSLIAQGFRRSGLETSLQTFRFLPRGPEHPGQTLTSENVLALLPGSDPTLAREVIVVGAHHDGQGMDGQADGGRYPSADPNARADRIWNSADDNASSVAAVLEIARVLAASPSRARRPIVFATFGAEEHALNGSAHLAQNPWPAGSRYVAMVNLEKIGRVPAQPLIMAGCSTSSDWAEVLDAANGHTDKVECVLPDLVPDTDHYPFGALGIPAVVLGTVHENDTHQPTDESSKIDFEALASRARYVMRFVQTLANRERTPGFAANARRGAGLVVVVASASERSAIGLRDGGALKVGTVLPGLPAAKAGLRVGDFVTAIDDKPLVVTPDDRLIQDTLIDHSPVRLSVRRGDSDVVVSLEAAP